MQTVFSTHIFKKLDFFFFFSYSYWHDIFEIESKWCILCRFSGRRRKPRQLLSWDCKRLWLKLYYVRKKNNAADLLLLQFLLFKISLKKSKELRHSVQHYLAKKEYFLKAPFGLFLLHSDTYPKSGSLIRVLENRIDLFFLWKKKTRFFSLEKGVK